VTAHEGVKFNTSSQALNGIWDLSPFDPKLGFDQSGKLQLYGSTGLQCLTVMKCLSNGNGFCDPSSTDPAVNLNTGLPSGLSEGSYLRFVPCYNAPGSNANLKLVQVWRQRSDCALGCPPWLQYDNKCEPTCNVKSCQFDSGNCDTKAPTPPTSSPTRHSVTTTSSPTITLSPTLPHTLAPTFTCPPYTLINNCPRLTRAKCLNKHVSKNCVWCDTTGCQARSSDPGLCVNPLVYQHCEPPCPSALAISACPNATTIHSCHGSKKHPNPCSWCSTSHSCIAGSLTTACANPVFYSHCLPLVFSLCI